MCTSIDEQALAAAQGVGLIARKDESSIGFENFGGYMVVDFGGIPVAGFRYDLTAQEVIEFCF